MDQWEYIWKLGLDSTHYILRYKVSYSEKTKGIGMEE